MSDYTPFHSGGAVPFTSQASATIVGGQVVMSTGNFTCGPATALSTAVIGVAAHDAATGAKVTVWPLKNVTHEVTSTGTIAAGALLAAGAAGIVAGTSTTYGDLVGRAVAGATGGAAIRFLGA